MTKEQKYGTLSTVLFLLLFSVLLIMFGFSRPYPPPEEEGILINFGTDDFGSGEVEPAPASTIAEQINTPQTVDKVEESSDTKADNAVEEVETQNFDEAVAIEAAKKEKEKKDEENRKKEEKRKEELRLKEEERLRNEKEERERKEKEERERKAAQQAQIDNRAKNLFGGNNPNGGKTGEGQNGGVGNQGNPDGSVDSKNRLGSSVGGDGISFELTGRNKVSLPKPQYDVQDRGIVVVEIFVDRAGNVISAVPGKKGTTTSNKALHQAAQKAALNAKFDTNSGAPEKQVGIIKYVFELE